MSSTDTVSKDGTDGLETVAYIGPNGLSPVKPILFKSQTRELVARSQAEDIIRDLETKILEAAISDRLDDAGSPLTWQERAEKAEADLAEERAEHDNTIATLTSLITDKAALIHDLNRIKDHETELVNDNAAKDARIKELERRLKEVELEHTGVRNSYFAERRKVIALEAKLAATEKALESYKSIVKDVCESQRGTKWGKAAECIFDAIERAVLEGEYTTTAEQAGPVPAINARFETSENGITGIRFVDVKRVEYEDDGSLTVVIDYWPEPARAVLGGKP